MNTKDTIESLFNGVLQEAGKPTIEFHDEMVLLQSGLDSLGFAMLVAKLENELGYDPFTMMEDAVYPVTFGEFVAIYERFANR